MTVDNRVKFGMAIPQIFAVPQADTAALRAFLTRAEALGFHSVWVQEQILGRGMASLEPVALLSYAAAMTRSLRLGSAVFLTLLRNPVQLAKSLATVDQLSNGRLIVGVGQNKTPEVALMTTALARLQKQDEERARIVGKASGMVPSH